VPCAYTMWAELDPSGNLIVEHGITSSTVSGQDVSPEGVLNIFEDQGRITVVNSGFSSLQNNRWYYNINRYDGAGTIIYSTYYDSEDEWGANGIKADRDQNKNIYLAGSGDQSIQVIKTDSNGIALWENRVYAPSQDSLTQGFGMDILPDNQGVICVGSTESSIFIAHIGPTGLVNWCKQYNNPNQVNMPHSLRVCDNGDILVGGAGFIMRLDSQGNVLTSRFFMLMFTNDIIEYGPNAIYVTAGDVFNSNSQFIMKLDDSLNPIWFKRIPGGSSFYVWNYLMEKFPDDELVIFGLSSNENYDFIRIKHEDFSLCTFDSMLPLSHVDMGAFTIDTGIVTSSNLVQLAVSSYDIQPGLIGHQICDNAGFDSPIGQPTVLVSPNPASDYLNIDSETPVDRIHIIDQFGKMVISESGSIIDVSNLSEGTYLVIIEINGHSLFRPFIKL